jgi:hypothetical protein
MTACRNIDRLIGADGAVLSSRPNALLVPRSNLRHVWRWPRILRILHTWPEFW